MKKTIGRQKKIRKAKKIYARGGRNI